MGNRMQALMNERPLELIVVDKVTEEDIEGFCEGRLPDYLADLGLTDMSVYGFAIRRMVPQGDKDVEGFVWTNHMPSFGRDRHIVPFVSTALPDASLYEHFGRILSGFALDYVITPEMDRFVWVIEESEAKKVIEMMSEVGYRVDATYVHAPEPTSD
ncbi:MAG: hypothetical protein ABIE94_03580 [archaeon]